MTFATPQQAEKAFYTALEQANLKALMQVWDTTQEIACVHPMGKWLRGSIAIEHSWFQIFRNGPRMHFEIEEIQSFLFQDTAVHTVSERIIIVGSHKHAAPLVATNIYRWHDNSWRMILHHASLAPSEEEEEQEEISILLH